VGLALLAGCSNSHSTTTISLNNGTGTILGSSAAKPELTLAQGRKLLLDIRKNPKRMEKLTIQERRFLAKALVAGNPEAEADR
jgi:hypothetical protein